MRKFPSIEQIIQTIGSTFKRFPLEIIIAIFGTSCAIYNFENRDAPNEKTFIKLLLLSSLLLVGQLSLTLYAESKKLASTKKWIASAVIIGLLSLFIFNFSERPTDAETISFIALNISLHLLVSFAGFLPLQYNQNQFWEFNKNLFLQILTSVLYSGVLYVGLAIAVSAIKNLFEVKIDDDIFFYLFVTIAGIFNTIFFLAGFPKIEQNATNEVDYPKGLKTFTQFVLLPLVCIYALILLCYEGKIIINWSLPVGWVSYLVLTFGIFGILSFLLVFPIADKEENIWMKSFKKWFYIILIPLLALLFWAILYRVKNYGFTHERYYVVLLAVWLTFVALYFLISKKDKIIVIPISMCLFGLFSIIGPQSAYSVSKQNQLARFENYLEKIKTQKLSAQQEYELSTIIDYLNRNYSNKVFKNVSNSKIQNLLAKNENVYGADFMKALGLNYRYSNVDLDNQNSFFNYTFQPKNYEVENVSGYDFVFSYNNFTEIKCDDCLELNGKKIDLEILRKDKSFLLSINNDTVFIPIEDFILKTEELTSNYTSDKEIIQIIDFDKYKIGIKYLNVNGKTEAVKKIIEGYSAKVMVKVK